MRTKVLIAGLVLGLAGNYWQYTEAQQRLVQQETLTAEHAAANQLSTQRYNKLKVAHRATDEAYAKLQDDHAMLEAEHDVIHSPAYELRRCADAVYEVRSPHRLASQSLYKRQRWCIDRKDEVLEWMPGRDYSDIESKRYEHRAS